MGTKKNVDMSSSETKVKIVKAPIEDVGVGMLDVEVDVEGKEVKSKKIVKKKATKTRGKKYAAARANLDKTKKLEPKAAIELIKKLSYSKFDGAIEANIMVKEVGMSFNFALPHSTGKSIKVAIVDDKVLKNIEAGKLDFDALICTPDYMPKIAKFAKVLGPKGLMPNPKNGTVTPKPELKKKELESGKMDIKTDKKAPLINMSVGKVSMDSKKLVENINTILKIMKGKIVKLSISASMSPGVKVQVE
jgi:large subunit ribosomal protein L1